jgi:hypothetical protein
LGGIDIDTKANKAQTPGKQEKKRMRRKTKTLIQCRVGDVKRDDAHTKGH